jgi:peptide/nickel transport system permease protein
MTSVRIAVAFLVLLVVVALLAPVIAPYERGVQVGPVFGPPSSEFLFGLDDGGADVLTEVLYGARVSLFVGFAAALVAVLVGTTVGVVAGYYGGTRDTVLMRITDYFLVIPDLVLAIIVAALYGTKIINLVFVIALISWASPARLMRSQVKTLREQVYIRRARALGARDAYIIRRHILPHLAPLMVVGGVLGIANAIFLEAALSFIGLGDPNNPSWGKMIGNAFSRGAVSAGAPWALAPPGIAIASVVLACTIIGRSLEDRLNPRLSVSHITSSPFKVLPRSARPRTEAVR